MRSSTEPSRSRIEISDERGPQVDPSLDRWYAHSAGYSVGRLMTPTLETLARAAQLDLAEFRERNPHPALVFLLSLHDDPDVIMGAFSGKPASSSDPTRVSTETARIARPPLADIGRTATPESGPPRAAGARRHASAPRLGLSPVLFLVKTSSVTPFEDVITLGRAPGQDVCVRVGSVSKLHACFTRFGDAWTITDESATNGTYLDERRLRTGERARLSDGAVVGFGPEVRAKFFVAESLPAYLERFLRNVQD